MWDLKIAGIDLYHVFFWLLIYSVIGWIWESSYVSIKNKKLVNRGFVTGPVVTIYGFGAVIIYLILHSFQDKPLLLYVGGVLVATALELVTGELMEAIFHTNWWDYSSKKYNFRGKICLGSSIAWGFFTLALFYVLHPFVEKIVGLVEVRAGKVILVCSALIYVVDFTMSAIEAFHLRERMNALDAVWEEFTAELQKHRLVEIAEELKSRARLYRYESSRLMKEHLAERNEAFRAQLEERVEESELAASLMEHYESFAEKYMEKKQQLGHITRRMVKAYPHLKLSEQNKEQRGKKKRQEKQK